LVAARHVSAYRIPFNRAGLAGDELRYVAAAIDAGHIAGAGAFTARCQALLEAWLGAPRVFLTTSGTHALEMAALLLGLGPGDEVIVPSFTFVSSASAFAIRGARPVFVDVRPDTLNLDEAALPRAVTRRTRAIVAVHYAGVACEMDAVTALAEERGLEVIEDNAHGLGGRYRGRFLGALGDLAVQSFHETKNFTCGEGGALVVNDRRRIERAEVLWEKGTDRARFFRGEVDKYTWVDLGSSFLPSELNAAFLCAQLEARAAIQQRRRAVWETYAERLAPWAAAEGVRLPVVPAHCEQAYHMFYLLMPSLDARTRLLAHLKSRGILAVFHFQPLHLSPVGARYGGRPGDCPVTEDVSDRLVRLPFYGTLTAEEQEEVCAAVEQVRCRG
jgi:dTDP-4-amino-4,6-dideoxygalactose transaminase